MKKLLVLVMVLSMASVASATLQISVNGDLDPVDTQIWLDPSQHLILDVWTDADISPFQSAEWMLVCNAQDGSITGGVAIGLPGAPANDLLGLTIDIPDAIPPAGMEGVAGFVANTKSDFTVIPAGTVLVDEIDFHCEWGPNEVMVGLYLMVSGEPVTEAELVDSVIIHQTPEPMTMVLLGLGGLGLLRRRR